MLRGLIIIFMAMMLFPACFFQAVALAQDLDLAPYARVKATDTRNTFFLLWPRETDDAPYTVRDGDGETSWKTATDGEQILTFDFAPTTLWPITFSELKTQWEKMPANSQVSVRVFAACGGESVFEGAWDADVHSFSFPEGVRGYCLEIGLENPGRAGLESLQVFAAPSSDIPKIAEVTIGTVGDSLSVNWLPKNSSVHHVEMHFVTIQGAKPDKTTLIDVDLLPDTWQGPLPPDDGRFLAVVPVAADGVHGETQYLELRSRTNELLPSSGVIEGFYGRPWSHAERRNMILFMARTGMGVYAYGPKNDPLHRDNWRALYDDEKMAEFEQLQHLARNLGVSFAFGISPGKDIDTESIADRQALLDKLAPFIEIGITTFVLLFDDIEGDISQPINAELGAEHAELGNWLLDQVTTLANQQVTLWLVPTVYSSERQNDWSEGEEYLIQMADLDTEIGLMWTGTGTSEDTLSAADIAEVTQLTGRKPIIWDNQHATDGGDGFWGRVYLAPILGRNADLVDATEGIMVNPMILGSANRMMLDTYAAYLRDPVGYDPDQALMNNSDLIGETVHDHRLALRQAQSYFGHAGINIFSEPIYPEMETALSQFNNAASGDDPTSIAAEAESLMKIAAEMVVSKNDLWHSGFDAPLVDDLWFPAFRLEHIGYTILHTLDSVRDRFVGGDGAASQELADQNLRQAAFDRYQLSPFKVMIWNRLLAKKELPSIDITVPAIVSPAVTKAETGIPWIYDPGVNEGVSIYGLPGAEINDGVVTFAPKHAGEYRGVVVANASGGWSWLEFVLTVSGEPELPEEDDTSDDDDDTSNDDDANDGYTNDDDEAGCGC